MKNLPLAVQIWLVFAAGTLIVLLLLGIFLPWTLRNFFTQQIYDLLQDSQNNIAAQIISVSNQLPKEAMNEPVVIYPPDDRNPRPFRHPGPRIRHVFFTEELRVNEGLGMLSLPKSLPQSFIKVIWQDAEEQKIKTQRYSRNIDDRTLFYIIRKETIGNKQGYLVSYSWATYRNDLVKSLFTRLSVLMLLLILLSWLPAIWLARYLTKPLVQMGKQIEKISHRDWEKPFILDRKDEIGKLAQAFEQMRQRLVRQDQDQQSFLQNVSHDLKTPVMVIQSYAQSILDGIFPKGNLEGSIDVINSEATKLEKRVHNLLYLNKITYLKGKDLQSESINLTKIVTEQIERIGWRRSEISWQVDLPSIFIEGNREQWEVVWENLLDNQIRYAKSRITINTVEKTDMEKSCLIRLWNDGPPIDSEIVDNVFERYYAGKDGEFGLGLSIVYHILKAHQAKIWVKNEEGVAFYIQLG